MSFFNVVPTAEAGMVQNKSPIFSSVSTHPFPRPISLSFSFSFIESHEDPLEFHETSHVLP